MYDERAVEETKQCQEIEHRLSPLERHKLIKKEFPNASTYYQRCNKGQMTFEEICDNWMKDEMPLKKEEPAVYEAFLTNIRRRN